MAVIDLLKYYKGLRALSSLIGGRILSALFLQSHTAKYISLSIDKINFGFVESGSLKKFDEKCSNAYRFGTPRRNEGGRFKWKSA